MCRGKDILPFGQEYFSKTIRMLVCFFAKFLQFLPLFSLQELLPIYLKFHGSNFPLFQKRSWMETGENLPLLSFYQASSVLRVEKIQQDFLSTLFLSVCRIFP